MVFDAGDRVRREDSQFQEPLGVEHGTPCLRAAQVGVDEPVGSGGDCEYFGRDLDRFATGTRDCNGLYVVPARVQSDSVIGQAVGQFGDRISIGGVWFRNAYPGACHGNLTPAVRSAGFAEALLLRSGLRATARSGGAGVIRLDGRVPGTVFHRSIGTPAYFLRDASGGCHRTPAACRAVAT